MPAKEKLSKRLPLRKSSTVYVDHWAMAGGVLCLGLAMTAAGIVSSNFDCK